MKNLNETLEYTLVVLNGVFLAIAVASNIIVCLYIRANYIICDYAHKHPIILELFSLVVLQIVLARYAQA